MDLHFSCNQSFFGHCGFPATRTLTALPFFCNQTRICPLLQPFFKQEFFGTTVFLQPGISGATVIPETRIFSGAALLLEPRL
jgi:hypothetical protein